MKRILKAIKTRILRLIGWLMPTDPRRIRLLSLGYSGSNTEALYELAPKAIADRFDVRVVPSGPTGSFFESLCYVADVARAKVLVSTHSAHRWNARQKRVELWHGFPLKGMNLMDVAEVRNGIAKPAWQSVDLVASYSSLYSSLINACMGLDAGRYAITGMPRNDLLSCSDGGELLDRVLGSPTGHRRVVFYMPTFRRSIKGRVDGDKSRINVFGFKGFDEERFARFLETESIRFIAKLHPFEERVFLAEGGVGIGPGIEALTDRALSESKVELYRLLSRADALLTDYSSVYFDLLLRDVPLVFSPVDIDAYRSSRGFLLEPYEFWAPGPKATNQDALELELKRSLDDRSYYASERKTICDIVHAHRDARSSERVWAEILRLAESR